MKAVLTVVDWSVEFIIKITKKSVAISLPSFPTQPYLNLTQEYCENTFDSYFTPKSKNTYFA